MGSLRSKHTSRKVQRTLANLKYDFSHFELTHFVDHVARYRAKPIRLLPFAFTGSIFGVWVPAPYHDYIFYSNRVHRIHQVHIVLHEIAHILLDHRRQRIDDVLPPELLRQLDRVELIGRLRVPPSAEVHGDEEEQESEQFVFLIQKQLVKARRLAELTGESSSIPGLKPITDTMGYTSE